MYRNYEPNGEKGGESNTFNYYSYLTGQYSELNPSTAMMIAGARYGTIASPSLDSLTSDLIILSEWIEAV